MSLVLPITSCICYGKSWFGDYWKFDSLAGFGGETLLLCTVLTDFKLGIKKDIFQTFLYSRRIADEEVLSDLENDVKQLEDNYIESTVIIISSLGFTTVSICYALWTNFYLGLLFIVFIRYLLFVVELALNVWMKLRRRSP